MTASKALAAGEIVWVDIPVVGRHLAVVVLCLNHGASYILVNGSSSPQDVSPTVTLSDPVAKRCRLDRATKFYCAKEFVWFWRPDSAPEPCGRLIFPQYQSDLRDGAVATMKTMSNVSAEIGKLPSHAGLTFQERKELKAILSQPDAPPVS